MTGNNTTSFYYPGSLITIPQDGKTLYYEAFAAAKKEIRIEICVLEDQEILSHLQQALLRNTTVKVIVDHGKYISFQPERDNLATYLTSSGGLLHTSNPIFPRSFPKFIIIDDDMVIVGSACLDSLTFQSYRDYAYVSDNAQLIQHLTTLFENDWYYSRPTNMMDHFPPYNPTPPIFARYDNRQQLLISPIDSSLRLVRLYQKAKRTLEV